MDRRRIAGELLVLARGLMAAMPKEQVEAGLRAWYSMTGTKTRSGFTEFWPLSDVHVSFNPFPGTQRQLLGVIRSNIPLLEKIAGCKVEYERSAAPQSYGPRRPTGPRAPALRFEGQPRVYSLGDAQALWSEYFERYPEDEE